MKRKRIKSHSWKVKVIHPADTDIWPGMWGVLLQEVGKILRHGLHGAQHMGCGEQLQHLGTIENANNSHKHMGVWTRLSQYINHSGSKSRNIVYES